MADSLALPNDGQHVMNAGLCEFARRWSLDGDYLRCRSCKRPQLAGYHHLPFQHADGCRQQYWETHPWQVLVRLLRPISAATQGGDGG